MLNLKNAKRAILVMGAISVAIALLHTFIDQSYVGALVGISSASVFYYLHRNPKMLMAKSWAELESLQIIRATRNLCGVFLPITPSCSQRFSIFGWFEHTALKKR